MKDTTDKDYAKISQLKDGDLVLIDAGFTCMRFGDVKSVCVNHAQRLFISCDDGEHYLDGQLGDDGDSLIGIYEVGK